MYQITLVTGNEALIEQLQKMRDRGVELEITSVENIPDVRECQRCMGNVPGRTECVWDEAAQSRCSEEIIGLFESRDEGIYNCISDTVSKLFSDIPDLAEAEKVLSGIYKNVIDELLRRNEWLDLYKSVQGPCEEGEISAGVFKEELCGLFEDYRELFPDVNNEKMQKVILHILNNPESDLKQKTIAAEYYINSSYLSTVFSAQTQLRFVDYLTTVKLKRAGWLLQNTAMKVAEIAARLDYKDIGYFSRVFKRQYGVTPTEYRIPDDYTYQI